MSKSSGDKSRFNRIRKANIRRRASVQALRVKLAANAAAAAALKLAPAS